MAWTDEARRKAAESRRRNAKGKSPAKDMKTAKRGFVVGKKRLDSLIGENAATDIVYHRPAMASRSLRKGYGSVSIVPLGRKFSVSISRKK